MSKQGKTEMSKRRQIQRNKQSAAQPMPVITEPPHSAFVITIAYDPQSQVVNFNTVPQGDGVVYVDDQIKALRNIYEMFVGRLAIEANKAAEAQQSAKG